MILKINDRIRNTKVEKFNDVNIDLKYDSVGSTFKFNFYFNPNDQSLIDLACIGHYHICTIEHMGELLLTGFILNESFSSQSVRTMADFSGYSLPGVLEDCEIPVTLYPLQNDGLTLAEIARKLVEPFKLGIDIDSSVSSAVNSVYDTSTASERQSIKSYLAELASQKNVILTHTNKGDLLFTRANTRKDPIANFDGSIPTENMKLSFNGQGMHSEITVIKQADQDGGNAGEATVKNPFVPFVYRPKVKVQNSGDDNDTEIAARSALASELKNLKVIIALDRWDINGKIITPNNIVTILNPEIYIFKKTRFFLESVNLTGNEKKQTAVLTCVLPSVYDGTTPEYIFDDINLH